MDSFWLKKIKEDKSAYMVAICPECHKKINIGIFWSEIQGYGDYDIKCDICNAVIHKKESI